MARDRSRLPIALPDRRGYDHELGVAARWPRRCGSTAAAEPRPARDWKAAGEVTLLSGLARSGSFAAATAERDMAAGGDRRSLRGTDDRSSRTRSARRAGAAMELRRSAGAAGDERLRRARFRARRRRAQRRLSRRHRPCPRSDREAGGRIEGDDRPGDEATLREAQRAWVAFRDAHCRLEGYEARGGTMEPLVDDSLPRRAHPRPHRPAARAQRVGERCGRMRAGAACSRRHRPAAPAAQPRARHSPGADRARLACARRHGRDYDGAAATRGARRRAGLTRRPASSAAMLGPRLMATPSFATRPIATAPMRIATCARDPDGWHGGIDAIGRAWRRTPTVGRPSDRDGNFARDRVASGETGMRSADVQEDPDREPGRDRLPRHPHRASGWGSPPSRSIRTPTRGRRMCRWPTRACGSGRRPPPRAISIAELIIDACKATGAEAVHPGYGFLSERESFARALAEAGIAFIGPPPERDRGDGRQDRIEEAGARRPGVNVVPGFLGEIADTDAGGADRRRDRLSGDDEGLGRRRRQGHAARL